MPCNDLISFSVTCESGAAPGVKGLKIGLYSTATVWSANTSGVIVGATAAPTFYAVHVIEENSQLQEEMVINQKVRNYNWRQKFDLTIVGQSQSAITWVNTVATAGMVMAVEMEETGIIKLLGQGKPIRIAGGLANAGIAAGDENTIKLNFSALASELAPTLSSAYYATL